MLEQSDQLQQPQPHKNTDKGEHALKTFFNNTF